MLISIRKYFLFLFKYIYCVGNKVVSCILRCFIEFMLGHATNYNRKKELIQNSLLLVLSSNYSIQKNTSKLQTDSTQTQLKQSSNNIFHSLNWICRHSHLIDETNCFIFFTVSLHPHIYIKWQHCFWTDIVALIWLSCGRLAGHTMKSEFIFRFIRMWKLFSMSFIKVLKWFFEFFVVVVAVAAHTSI